MADQQNASTLVQDVGDAILACQRAFAVHSLPAPEVLQIPRSSFDALCMSLSGECPAVDSTFSPYIILAGIKIVSVDSPP